MSRIVRWAAWSLGLAAALSPAAEAQRPVLEVAGLAECAPVAARYVVLLRPERPAIVLSAAGFPGASPLEVKADGLASGRLSGYGEVVVPVAAAAEVWALADPALQDAPVGCLGFDKDRFTWASDLLTYVRYLARQLFAAAREMEPDRTSLVVRERSVRLEVTRPGRDRATLEGVEGGMLGYGSIAEEQRWFFLPVVLDEDEPSLLVRVFSNRGRAFGDRATTPMGWVRLTGEETVVTPTDPSFELRLVGLDG